MTKAWTCPSIYKEKATQKKYKEIWDERTSFFTGAIAGDNYIHDTEVYTYVDGIINQIVQANKQLIPVKPMLLIDRSSSVNAYAIGNNIIAVNLGLIVFSQSREELSLGGDPINIYDRRHFYLVTNRDTKSNYVIINDEKDIFVYNASQKKTIRTIPHKDGNLRTNVFPAKEGHMMIATYNGSETRVSIEAL